MKSTLIYCLAFLALFSCQKTKSGNEPQPAQYRFTRAICGTRSFHYVTSGYNPYLKQTVSDSSNETDVITYVDAKTVSFGSYSFVYDTLMPSGTVFYQYATGEPPNYGYVSFDTANNGIFIYLFIHVSAGGGEWTSTYTSY